MFTIPVIVKDAAGTYTARAQGKSASCTAGAEQAVQALAKKLGHAECRVKQTEIRPHEWIIVHGSKCEVCGNTPAEHFDTIAVQQLCDKCMDFRYGKSADDATKGQLHAYRLKIISMEAEHRRTVEALVKGADDCMEDLTQHGHIQKPTARAYRTARNNAMKAIGALEMT